MQHGLSLTRLNNNVGTCCYNTKDPSIYKSYDIDPEACRACLDQENNGVYSYRQGVNQKYGLEHSHRLPLVLDLTPNRNCNLTCKICSEYSSSSWVKLKQIKIRSDYNTSIKNFERQIADYDLSQVKEINFSGGETFLNNNISRYINRLESKINFAQCTLRFVSNGTYRLTASIIDLFTKFKLVQARFSFDDIGSGYEYQRPPAVWAQVENHWQYFLDHMPHNTMVAINRTVSILNINRLHLLDKWHAQSFQYSRFQDPIELIDHFAFGPYNINTVPDKLKQLILNSHGNNSRAWSYIKNRPVNDNIHNLKSTINQHDALHHTSLEQFDPDLYRALFI